MGTEIQTLEGEANPVPEAAAPRTSLLSRTTTLLSKSAFLANLAKVTPSEANLVLRNLNALIQQGENERSFIVGEDQKVCGELESLEAKLVNATKIHEQKTNIVETNEANEESARANRDEAREELDDLLKGIQ